MNTPKMIELATQEEAYTMMDRYFDMLQTATTTGSRAYASECMSKLCERFPILNLVWEYVSTASRIVNRWIKKVTSVVTKIITDGKIIWECAPIDRKANQFYIIDLVNKYGKVQWGKIGTTTRETWARMKEHLKYYERYGIEKIVVKRVYDCGDVDPETFEDVYRTYFKRLFGRENFLKNDRFLFPIDCELADRLFEKTLKEEREFVAI